MLNTALEHDLIDVAMKCLIREGSKDADAIQVIKDSIGRLSEAARGGIEVRQDAVAARMQPIPGACIGVTLDKAGSNGTSRGFMVRSVGGVFKVFA